MAATLEDEEFDEDIRRRLKRVVKEANQIQVDLEKRRSDAIQRQNSSSSAGSRSSRSSVGYSRQASSPSSKASTPSSSLEKNNRTSHNEEGKKHSRENSVRSPTSPDKNRFFRESNFSIVDGNTDATLIQWYGHFNGQRLIREMLVRPGKRTKFYISGRHDAKMKPETLDESGLANKKGAEISNVEFENDWKRNGGEPFYY